MRRAHVATVLVVPIAVAAFSASSSGESPAPAAAAPPVGVIDPAHLPRTVAVRDVADHLVVDVTFGSDGPHAFMLDTGAPTVLAEALRLRVGGPAIAEINATAAGGPQVTQEVFPIDALSIDGLDIRQVIALEGWVESDNPLSCITENGLIGANAMAGAVWQLDYRAGTATVASSTKGLDHVDGAIALDFQATPGPSPTPIVAIPSGPAGFVFVVDTGSDAGLIAPPAAFAAAAIDLPADAPTERGRASGAAGDVDLTLPYVQTRLDLGRIEVEYPTAAADIGTHGLGNMGNAFLSKFVVTFDWTNHTLFLDPVSEDGTVGPPERTTAGLGWEGGKIVVNRLQEGTPAAAAGLELGAVVTSVDGRDVSRATRDDFCALMTGASPSTIVTEGGASYDVTPDEGFFRG